MTTTNHKKINKGEKKTVTFTNVWFPAWKDAEVVSRCLPKNKARAFSSGDVCDHKAPTSSSAPTRKEGWENWEREFDEQFSVFDGSQKIVRHVTYSSWVKDFISQLLLQQKSELIKEIENILKDCTDAFGTTDYKMFAEKVISLPKRMKPKTTRTKAERVSRMLPKNKAKHTQIESVDLPPSNSSATTSGKSKTVSTQKGKFKYKIQK